MRPEPRGVVEDARNTTPHGPARVMLDHVLASVDEGLPIERHAAETLFVRLVLDDRWSVENARLVYAAVCELAATPTTTKNGEVHHA